MLQIIKKITLVLLLMLSLQAQGGLNQKHLVSLSPQNLAQDVSADKSIEIEYDLAISKRSLPKSAVVLKDSEGKKIRGKVRVKNRKTLIFTPSKELASGEYSVKVKRLNLQEYKSKTNFKRYSKKFCSYFYDDVKECGVYRYACSVKSRKIKYSFSVDDNRAKVISISLNKSSIQLNEDNVTTISVDAEYDNNETVDITDQVEWIMSDSNVISIDKDVITPLSEGTTTLQAKFNSQTTVEISVTVYREINGYKLPPEPDETLNNATLLGVDVNDNGVRDDVERLIIIEESKNNEYPKTQVAIAFQYASAWQNMIENPIIESREYLEKASSCQWYWFNQKLKDTRGFLIRNQWRDKQSGQLGIRLTNKIFNTKERILQRFEFNQACSGQIFDRRDKGLDDCQINLDELGE